MIYLLHINDYDRSTRDDDLVFEVKLSPKSDAVAKLAKNGGYVAVAVADTEDLEEVFAATQNGVRVSSWSRQNPDPVKALGKGTLVVAGTEYGYRDTSVGDVLVVDGKPFVCAIIGFEECDIPADVLAAIPVMGGGQMGAVTETAPTP